MKLDVNKEMLIKHRFWIVLGVTFCVILTGMLFAYSEDAKKKQDEINAALLKGDVKGDFQGPTTIEVRQTDAKRAKDLESNVWSKAYKDQEKIYTWAPQVEAEFNFSNGKFANSIKIDPVSDPKSWPADSPTLIHGVLTNVQRDWFEIKDRKDKPVKIYLTQNIVDPGAKVMNVKITGQKDIQWGPAVGQFINNKVFAVTYQVGKYFYDPLTISEQKTFGESYKTQIYPILEIVDPLDTEGNGVVQLRNWLFTREEFPPDGNFIRYVNMPWNPNNDFSDEAWIAQENLWIQKEIYQIIRSANDKISKFEGKGGEKRGERYVFTNSYFELSLLLNADSSVSLKIKNLLNKRQPIDLSFRVHMDKSRKPEILKISDLPLAPAGDKGGKDSYVKTFPYKKDEAPRKGIYSLEQVLSWETAAVKRIDHVSIGSNSGGDISHSQRTFLEPLRPFQMAGMPPAGAAKAPAAAADGAMKGGFAHGLWPNRYVEVSEQSRRIPVAVVLIVDQAHVDRVLTAFNNSKLRFLDTQVLLNLYPQSLQPLVGGREVGGTPGRPAGGGGSQSLETNMEMVIYGIMTLYQRFPPRAGFTAEVKKT